MFDIGFWEICLIGIVALVIVGPDRFPGMIRSAGYWMGRFRQIASNVKNEIQTEVDKAEQLKELLAEQENILKRQVDDEVNELQGVSPAAQRAAQSNNALLDSSEELAVGSVEKTKILNEGKKEAVEIAGSEASNNASAEVNTEKQTAQTEEQKPNG